MMNKRDKSIPVVLVGVFFLFALLVPVYWAVSSEDPDGLDTLLEQQNVQEKGFVYSPPLAALQDYGATMPIYIISGIIGGLVVLTIVVLIGRALKRDNEAA